jgi:glycosyltransferase involved in cell wall biosynthesis
LTPGFSLLYGTNIWTHHQVPVASELALIMGPERFRMALFERVPDERRQLGWEDGVDCPWVIGPPKSNAEMKQIVQQCLEADVMVVGACTPEVLQARVATGKLTLVASERLLKKGFYQLRMLNPRYAMGFRRYCSTVNHPHVHSLSIGFYAPADLRTIGAFADRIWKWGYFVEVNPLPPAVIPDRPLKLLWVGRMLDWKKVDLLLQAVGRIQDAVWFGECLIVGDGPERSRLERLGNKLWLQPAKVRFQQSVPFDEVRRLMREADVYVLPSNREEGWGAVAGEAMSEGCLLVANGEAGASHELIVDGETGFLYRDGNLEQLVALLERLGNDPALRMRVRQQAWERMQNVWHPRVAAERLVTLCRRLLNGDTVQDFSNGPCSRV